MDTSGFYKELENGDWLFAQNFVDSPTYHLDRNGNRESVDGWVWYDEAPDGYIVWKYKQENKQNNTPLM